MLVSARSSGVPGVHHELVQELVPEFHQLHELVHNFQEFTHVVSARSSNWFRSWFRSSSTARIGSQVPGDNGVLQEEAVHELVQESTSSDDNDVHQEKAAAILEEIRRADTFLLFRVLLHLHSPGQFYLLHLHSP